MEEHYHQHTNDPRDPHHDPERDGYYPDKIYDAPPSSSQSRAAQDDPVFRHIPHGKAVSKLYDRWYERTLQTIGFVLSIFSIVLLVIALVLPSSVIGLVLHIAASVLAAVGLTCAIIGGQQSLQQGRPWGTWGVIVCLVAAIVLLLSGVLLPVTGCRACFSAACSLWVTP